VACIAGSVESIGRAALTDRTVAFNQQINAIQPSVMSIGN
jgi:type I restriction enzyme S subunit